MNNDYIKFIGGICKTESIPITSNVEGLLIRVIASGLCGTDIQILKGIRNEKTEILGHEGLGIIENYYNKNGYFFKRGQTIFINPTDRHDTHFLLGHNIPGLFQKYITIPDSAVQNGVIIPIKYTLSPLFSALIEPIAVALTALETVESFSPMHYVIIGGGIVGNLIGKILGLKRKASPLSLVHGSNRSMEMSQSIMLPSVKHFVNDKDVINNLLKNEKTAVFITTPKNVTNSVISTTICSIQNNSVIDVISGIDSSGSINAKSASLLYNTRAKNICLENDDISYLQANKYYLDDTEKNSIFLTGHRGASNKKMIEAFSLLNKNQKLFHDMITHVVDFVNFSDFLNEIISSKNRVINGKYVLKTVILNSDGINL
ncbi:alcohol dehydrogenase catalytic domain-containing protein [Xenorhabdus bovienii]|uniref:alcohol dehydrogenase catalytic domain-containing protein n=1 Tax=Xenorhabdus bovienii TaxID=40576 RepID=UPI00237D306B|nr:alcohol dehydrogenase catalytic domain-containing protein [Xenorhabdus bovienii]MDE1495188.1 alcohol dehydrogenase catalytic domain-containing protein [Xenorhabdus bovienii]MDE9473272.1 alcohol dehydrogenase catalytic domain-containing protein [Xenorhabdus bovienii]